SLPRRSVKRVSILKQVTKAAVKPAPECSPDSTFQPSTGSFTPFPKFAHARNSAALSRENPLFAINPDFVELGSVLETQNAHFTMQDLMQVNWVIRNPSVPSQACISALARRDLEANSAPLPGYKCQACSSRSLKCLGSLDVVLAMDALNALVMPWLQPDQYQYSSDIVTHPTHLLIPFYTSPSTTMHLPKCPDIPTQTPFAPTRIQDPPNCQPL
ncbi:hypothetical protein EV359DRAFT_69310, partial [Lentinula novae-zelandiae]